MAQWGQKPSLKLDALSHWHLLGWWNNMNNNKTWVLESKIDLLPGSATDQLFDFGRIIYNIQSLFPYLCSISYIKKKRYLSDKCNETIDKHDTIHTFPNICKKWREKRHRLLFSCSACNLFSSSFSSSLSSLLVLLTSKTMSLLGSTRRKLRHSKVRWPAK